MTMSALYGGQPKLIIWNGNRLAQARYGSAMKTPYKFFSTYPLIKKMRIEQFWIFSWPCAIENWSAVIERKPIPGMWSWRRRHRRTGIAGSRKWVSARTTSSMTIARAVQSEATALTVKRKLRWNGGPITTETEDALNAGAESRLRQRGKWRSVFTPQQNAYICRKNAEMAL